MDSHLEREVKNVGRLFLQEFPNFMNDSLESFLVVSLGLVYDAAMRIDDVIPRDVHRGKLLVYLPFGIGGHGKGQILLFLERGHLIHRMLPADTQDRKPFVFKFLPNLLLQMGHFGHAGTAPRSEKVD